ncbi:MAG: nucleotide exchange factor GrpE [Anaerolineae bacterium]|nr:nucleotide exchange factor GrpE [Anaerolineae bacterium]
MISRFRRKPDQPSGETEPITPDPMLRLEMQIAASHNALLEAIAGLEKQLARAAREQLKANALNESALKDAQDALEMAQMALTRLNAGERPSKIRPTGPLPALPPADTRLLEALMPILDGIEAGLDSGTAQLITLRDEDARRILRGWLDGQRLLRQRLLTLLEKESIRPIPTIGQVFDPYRHVAVETVYDPNRPPGTIIEERRRGYELNQRVLRFADVVVTKNREDASFL